jgi:hypothetical protein
MNNQNPQPQVAAKTAKHPKSRTTLIFEIIVYTLVVTFWVQFLMHL